MKSKTTSFWYTELADVHPGQSDPFLQQKRIHGLRTDTLTSLADDIVVTRNLLVLRKACLAGHRMPELISGRHDARTLKTCVHEPRWRRREIDALANKDQPAGAEYVARRECFLVDPR